MQSQAGAISLTDALGDSPAALPQTYEKAWDATSGGVLSGFPRLQDGFPFFVAPLVADLDQLSQRAVIDSNDSGWIHAYEPTGGEAPGFPKFTGQWPSFSGVVGDPRSTASSGSPTGPARARCSSGASRAAPRQRLVVALPPRRAQQRPVRKRHATPGRPGRDPNHARDRRRHPSLARARRRRGHGRPGEALPGVRLPPEDHHRQHRPGPPAEGAGPGSRARRNSWPSPAVAACTWRSAPLTTPRTSRPCRSSRCRCPARKHPRLGAETCARLRTLKGLGRARQDSNL